MENNTAPIQQPQKPPAPQQPKVPAKPKNPSVPPQADSVPELASRTNANDAVIPVQKKETPAPKTTANKRQTVLDVGPAKKKINYKKIGRIFGFIVLGIVVLGALFAGYSYFLGLKQDEAPTERIRRTREVEVQEIEEDPKSLDALEKRFNDFGAQVEIMENDANFENELDLDDDEF